MMSAFDGRAILAGILHPVSAVDWLALFVLLGFILVLAASIALWLHHWVSASRKRRRARELAAAGILLTQAVPHGADGMRDAVRAAHAQVGLPATGHVLRELRLRLAGPTRDILTGLLDSSGEITRLEGLSRSWWGWQRVQAAKELGDSGGARALHALRQQLNDRVPAVRAAAREALAGNPDGAADALASFIADPERANAHHSSAIAKISRTAPDILRAALAEGRANGHLLLVGLAALGDVGDAGSAPLARAAATAKDPDQRALSLRVLGQLRATDAAATVLGGLDDPMWFVRAAAARALGQFDSAPRHAEALHRALTDTSWWVRHNAATALARHAESRDQLREVARTSGDRYARDAAQTALLGARIEQEATS